MVKKELKCGTVIPGCDFIVHAESNAELLLKTAEHARSVHGIDRIPDELAVRILTVAAEE